VHDGAKPEPRPLGQVRDAARARGGARGAEDEAGHRAFAEEDLDARDVVPVLRLDDGAERRVRRDGERREGRLDETDRRGASVPDEELAPERIERGPAGSGRDGERDRRRGGLAGPVLRRRREGLGDAAATTGAKNQSSQGWETQLFVTPPNATSILSTLVSSSAETRTDTRSPLVNAVPSAGPRIETVGTARSGDVASGSRRIEAPSDRAASAIAPVVSTSAERT